MDWPARQSRIRALVDEYYLPLYRYAYRLTASPIEAEDLTQDAFCRAQMQLHQLRDPRRVRSWLFAILRNNFLRQDRDTRNRRVFSLDTNAIHVPTSPVNSPDDGQELQSALDQLPEAYRTPLILYYFEDFTYRDIADQMDIPIGTVMSRLARAKAFLRQKLDCAAANGESS